jgi:hypothetical protein
VPVLLVDKEKMGGNSAKVGRAGTAFWQKQH